jgi:N-acetylneuraminic acid mutarotase
MLGRILRLAATAIAGGVLAIGAYVGFQVVTSPGTRDARDWQLLATLPDGRGETAAAVEGGRLYVLGGLTGLGLQATAEASRYDPANDAWERLPDLPAARHHAAAAAFEGLVYLSGGGSSTGEPQSTLWVYLPADGTWATLSPMPQARFAHRMVAVGELLYVVGGIGGAAVLIYDPATDTWSTGTQMPAPRDHLTAVAVGEEVWAIGGRVDGQVQERVDIYDTGSDTWRAGPALPRATSAAAEGVVKGLILISGGEDPAGGVMVDAHWQLDTAYGDSASWQALSPPPIAVHGAHGAVINDRFMIAGGASRPGSSSRFAWSSLLQAYSPPA